jgi:hypothetical protein
MLQFRFVLFDQIDALRIGSLQLHFGLQVGFLLLCLQLDGERLVELVEHRWGAFASAFFFFAPSGAGASALSSVTLTFSAESTRHRPPSDEPAMPIMMNSSHLLFFLGGAAQLQLLPFLVSAI